MDDIVNNTGNRRLRDSPDIDSSSSLNNLRDLVDKINKDNQTDKSDQIDFDKLAELTKARLALGNLKPLEPFEPVELSVSRASDIEANVPKIQKDEKSTNKDIKKQNELSYGSGAGEKFVIHVKELEIKNAYNDINYLNNKLKNNNLTLAEYKKISNDTDQLKKSISKKEKELYELRKSAKKRTKTDQAKSFKDQNK